MDHLLNLAVRILEERFRRAGIPRGTVRRPTLEWIACQPTFLYAQLVQDTISLWRRHRYAVLDGPLAWRTGGGLAWISDEMDGDQILVQVLGARSCDFYE